jgi:Flp pilus assembly protein TadG
MRNKQRGQALIEFALILPVACIMMLGAADLLMLISTNSNLNYVAQQTAVWCSETTSSQPNCLPNQEDGGSVHASQLATAVNLPTASTLGVSLQCPQGSPQTCTGILGGRAQVTINYTWNLIFPLPGISSVNLTAIASAP